jgi:arginase
MAEAAFLRLPYPEVAVVEEDTLREQTLALAAALPERPVVLGGCCCAHTGAVEGLAARHGALAVVWLDAHGDLNTPETSPSGNLWGMPLRMLLDSGTVEPEHTVLVGARSLDPPEEEFIRASGIRIDPNTISEALERVEAVYVAFDCDVLEPDQGVSPHMPEPGGLTVDEATGILERVREAAPVAGIGFTGLTAAPGNAQGLARFAGALGL